MEAIAKTQQPLEITRDLVEIRINNFKGKITKLIEIMLGGGDEMMNIMFRHQNKCLTNGAQYNKN